MYSCMHEATCIDACHVICCDKLVYIRKFAAVRMREGVALTFAC